MANSIKIAIKGRNIDGTDAPTVEDLLDQISDFVSILQGVEDAVAEFGDREIDWRVTDASRNSPLSFELTPFPRQHAMNVEARVFDVLTATSVGISSLIRGEGLPLYFSDKLVDKVERVLERVTNGLDETRIDLENYVGIPQIVFSKQAARGALQHLIDLRSPEPINYRELGSVEGFITKVELDGFNRPIVWLRQRIDGQSIKCISRNQGLERIWHYEVCEVLKGLRVRVFGLINYKDLEKVSSIDVDDVHVFEPDDQLPDFGDIVAPDFTGGVEASEYLRRIRNDG